MKSGIYQIRNTVNGKLYIGSSQDIKFRWQCHVNDLRGRGHHSSYLQRSWNKYGKKCFEFEVLEYVAIESLIQREQFYLDTLNPVYNTVKTAGRVTHDEAFKQRLGERNRNRVWTDESKTKSSKTKTGKKRPEGWGEAHGLVMKKKRLVKHLWKWVTAQEINRIN